ncbi:MAG TPA: hypothetical protein VLA97_03095 [Nocardioidaceae bacterium]|nr:hypothetical protein [Nocardioidaceae bacterium]
MFLSRFMPCSQCGESVDRTAAEAHRCDPERLLDYQMVGLRPEIDGFESSMRSFLDGSRGRFEVWLAARQVRDTA